MNHDNLAAARRLVSELCGTIDHVAGPLLHAGLARALLDFPHHANIGDEARSYFDPSWTFLIA